MRTTLVLDDGVYDSARRRAFEQRRSLGSVISELAQKGLEAERNGQGARGVRFGAYAGEVWIADAFDETPQAWLDAMEAPIEPGAR